MYYKASWTNIIMVEYTPYNFPPLVVPFRPLIQVRSPGGIMQYRVTVVGLNIT